MIEARFIFRQAARDEEFERLNDRILEAAEANPGYRGRETWRNDAGDVAVDYRWDSLDDLRSFAGHPVHRQAKARWEEWYDGYRVQIGRILRTYGGDSGEAGFAPPG